MPATITVTNGRTVIQAGENSAAAARSAIEAATSASIALTAAGPNYASSAAGLAATDEGDVFAVESSGIVTVYRHDAGPTATALRVLPTSAYLAAATGAAAVGFSHSTAYASGTIGARFKQSISVKDAPYSAVGDGVADDTAAVTAAALAAQTAGAELVFPPGTYLIDDYIPIRNGVRAVRGAGGVIKCATGSTAGILLQGVAGAGLPANVSGCIFNSLVIDLNDTTSIGIYGFNPNNCVISNNRIYGGDSAQAGILIKAFDAGGEDAYGNSILNNTVDGGANTGSAGIQLVGETTYAARDNTLTDNITYGWQYGIGFGPNCPRNHVKGGSYSGALRSISIQGTCNDCTVDGAALQDFTGVAVHIVDSDRVKVSNCKARSSLVASGEGAFQAYKGAENCTFENCDTYIPSTSGNGPDFHFYAGASVTGTKFINCRANGVVYRSYFCLESAYKETAYAQVGGVSVGRNKSGVTEGDATGATTDAGFIGCSVVNPLSARPAFAFTQITAGSLRALTRAIFKNCQSPSGAVSHHLYLHEENSGSLSDMELTDFFAPVAAATANTVLPRGTKHAASVGGSSIASLNQYDALADVTFANSWVDYGGARSLRVRKDGMGRVYINGAIKNGTTAGGTTMFTLPTGFRPVVEEVPICYSNVAAASVIINPDGTVQVVAGVSATDLSFNCSFPTV